MTISDTNARRIIKGGQQCDNVKLKKSNIMSTENESNRQGMSSKRKGEDKPKQGKVRHINTK